MPTVKFLPSGEETTVEPDLKLLVVARRQKIDIRFGCSACRCGTCAVRLDLSQGTVAPMQADEKALLERMKLDAQSGTIRLACRTKVMSGTVIVDLAFQDTYSPDEFIDDV